MRIRLESLCVAPGHVLLSAMDDRAPLIGRHARGLGRNLRAKFGEGHDPGVGPGRLRIPRIPSTESRAATKCISEVPGFEKTVLTPEAASVLTRLSAPFIGFSFEPARIAGTGLALLGHHASNIEAFQMLAESFATSAASSGSGRWMFALKTA